MIADRGWTRALLEAVRNVDAETRRPRTPSRVEAEDEVVTSIDRYDDVNVFIGLDVGKGEHHAVALDPTGKRLFDKALPNDETRLRAVLDQLAGHGLILLVVDQPATIGALPRCGRPGLRGAGRLPAGAGDAAHRGPAPG